MLCSVKAKRTSDKAKIPKRATDGSAGYDLYSAEAMVIPARGRKCVSTHIQVLYFTNDDNIKRVVKLVKDEKIYMILFHII